MLAEQAVLVLGTFLLLGCGGSLLLIYSREPRLHGVNWMGFALLCGGMTTALALIPQNQTVSTPIAEFCVVGATLLYYRANRSLSGREVNASISGIVAITLGGATASLLLLHLLSSCFPALMLASLVTVPLLLASHLSVRGASRKMPLQVPIGTCLIGILLADILVRVFLSYETRAVTMKWPTSLDTVAYSIFIASPIALAFAFLWRSTARLTDDITRIAETDPLTRVFNRRAFLQWCEKEERRSRELQRPFSVLLLDFDKFKAVNDRFGHHVGDEVLCAAVERIQDAVRGIDVLCRWGGEEFAVLLPNANEDAAVLVGERIRKGVSSSRFSNIYGDKEPFPLRLTVSIGAASFDHGFDSFEAMLRRADTSLYAAKHAGRDRVILALPREAVSSYDTVSGALHSAAQ